MNIVEPILLQAKMNPDGLAICTPGTRLNSVSYAGLVRMMNNIARRAVWEGLKAGDTVGIFVEDKIFHIAIMLALTRLGIVTVSMRSPNLPRELGVSGIVADRGAPFENGGRVFIAEPGWAEGDGKSLTDKRVYQGTQDDICRIVLTSGTTGAPKGVAYSHNLLTEKIGRHHYIKGNRFWAASRVYCDVGLASSPGFKYLIYLLTKGGTIFFYGESAESTVQAFDLYKIQSMFAAPSGLAEYLKFFEDYDQLQCCFDHIATGGGTVSRALYERLQARMTPHVYSSYGAAESCTIACAPSTATMHIHGAVGWVMPDVTVEIVDESDRPLPPGKEGIVRTRSRFVAKGYVGDPPDGRNALRDGWFYPGDIGYLTGDDMLVVLGRDNAVLNVKGDKVAPEIVEEAIKSFGGIEDAAVFTRNDELGVSELWAVIVARTSIDQEALHTHCAARLERAFVPSRFVPVGKIPRNDMGKIERARLPELLKP